MQLAFSFPCTYCCLCALIGSLVAIGIASQVSAEFMASKSSTHSFWILVGVSLVMMIIQVVFKQLLDLRSVLESSENLKDWQPWVHILVIIKSLTWCVIGGTLLTFPQTQTIVGMETIVWTLYGSATGQCKNTCALFWYHRVDLIP